jgi:beta-phosphoglucomutase-like phosphatase (HAD superfamily)
MLGSLAAGVVGVSAAKPKSAGGLEGVRRIGAKLARCVAIDRSSLGIDLHRREYRSIGRRTISICEHPDARSSQ